MLLYCSTGLVRDLAVKMETRQVRAWEMLSNGKEIKRIDENAYRVKSQSGKGAYLVFVRVWTGLVSARFR